MYPHLTAFVTYTDENGKRVKLWTPLGSPNYYYTMRGGPYKGQGRFAYTNVRVVYTDTRYDTEPANA